METIQSHSSSSLYKIVPGINNCPKIKLSSPDGASAEIYLHGGHLTSWKPVGREEKIYLSEKSHFGPDASIRGGIPVIFPQFAENGPFPKHGFARRVDWELSGITLQNGETSATLKLADNAVTRKIWPFAFQAFIIVSISKNTLMVKLEIQNNGNSSFSFTSALHSYFNISNILDVSIEGLNGLTYIDSTLPEKPVCTQVDQALRFTTEVDRIYTDVQRPLKLMDPNSTLSINSAGFPDVVVWNPWDEKCKKLDDMPPDGYRHMLCIEAAAVKNPIHLAPYQSWSGFQQMVAE